MNKRSKQHSSTRPMSLQENGSKTSLQNLPDDLLAVKIFSKLDLKSVAICRCASKSSSSLLRRSDFTELFLANSCSRSPKLLFVCHKNSEMFLYSSPQPQNPDENSSPLDLNYHMKFAVDCYSAQTEVVYGLICLKDLQILREKPVMFLKICNPSTGQMLTLPRVKTQRNNVWSVFGYDPKGGEYKVLAMSSKSGICGEFQVLTLGSTKMSWKMIKCDILHKAPEQKICINGFIYYTPIDWLKDARKVVCFDVRFEKFSSIDPIGMTNFLSRLENPTVNLINFKSKLGLLLCERDIRFILCNGTSIEIKLWVLEDLQKEEWSEYTFSFPTVPENIIEEDMLHFVGVTQTNEIVLSSSFRHYLVYLNLEKNTIVKVAFQGLKTTGILDSYHTFLHHVENVKLY